MTVGPSMLASRDYWNTPRRGFINLWTGKFEQSPDVGPGGGPPYRGESDEEFEARLAIWDAHPYEPPRFIEPRKKARYRIKAHSSKKLKS